MTTYEEEDLFATGAPSLSFKDAPIGTSYTGTIIKKPEQAQSRNFDTGLPETWPDGNPKMSVVITMLVAGEEKSLWARNPSGMYAALRDAQKAADALIRPGGTLTVTFVGEKPNERNPRLNPQKLYSAQYVPPVEQVNPFGVPVSSPTPAPGPVTAPVPPPAFAAPAPAPATAEDALAGLSPDQIAALAKLAAASNAAPAPQF